MKGFVTNIEADSVQNEYFRRVLYTDTNAQLVLMALQLGEDIGEEVHDVDQFFRVEKGSGKAVLGGTEHAIQDGSVVIIPAGTKHNIINGSEGPMKLYTLYMPPHHKDGVVHKTKTDAENDTEHFDGVLTETNK